MQHCLLWLRNGQHNVDKARKVKSPDHHNTAIGLIKNTELEQECNNGAPIRTKKGTEF